MGGERSGVSEKMRDIIVVGDTGQAVIVLMPYLIRVIKSSASVDRQAYGSVANRDTRGFRVANYQQLQNDNASCRRATQCDDGDGCLAPQARRHTIGRCHVAQHIGNCVFWQLEKKFFIYDLHISCPRTFRSRFCRKFCDLYASIVVLVATANGLHVRTSSQFCRQEVFSSRACSKNIKCAPCFIAKRY